VWELSDPRIAKEFDRGDIVKVRGCISRYDDRAQMKVDQLRRAHRASRTNWTCCPRPARTWAHCGASLRQRRSLANTDLKRLLHALLADTELRRRTARRLRHGNCIMRGWADCWKMW